MIKDCGPRPRQDLLGSALEAKPYNGHGKTKKQAEQDAARKALAIDFGKSPVLKNDLGECRMQLLRLEIYGFKSFANRTELTFSPGITAIVGPNGCGKSNVVDAVRWVLGEQNPRNLRANKMEDLIYAGSENSAHKNFAEVSIVLDNSDKVIPLDYEEITITRRYYRSGDSEYFLNRVPCRLKDIHEYWPLLLLGKGHMPSSARGRWKKL